MKYKVITIKQPYAHFISRGYKTIETRTKKTNYRGKVLVHAAKKDWTGWKDDYRVNWVHEDDLEHGNILCSAELVDCVPITEEFVRTLDARELSLGFYTPYRYAWILKDITPVIDDEKLRGYPWLWDVDRNYEEWRAK